jgi:hypothetical protein
MAASSIGSNCFMLNGAEQCKRVGKVHSSDFYFEEVTVSTLLSDHCYMITHMHYRPSVTSGK